MNYYEHHLGDYARDTAHLSMLEDAAYRRLLDAYYAREKPMPADVKECCRIVRAQSKAERSAVATVLKEFFTLLSDGHHQTRADAEIGRFKEKSQKAQASANARWSQSERNAFALPPHSERIANGYANEMPTQCEGNAPNLQTPVTKHQNTHTPPREIKPTTATGNGAAEAAGVCVDFENKTGPKPAAEAAKTAISKVRQAHAGIG